MDYVGRKKTMKLNLKFTGLHAHSVTCGYITRALMLFHIKKVIIFAATVDVKEQNKYIHCNVLTAYDMLLSILVSMSVGLKYTQIYNLQLTGHGNLV